MTFDNNGILIEILSNYILPNIFDINSLIYYQEPSFEQAEAGNDLLFFDSDGNIYIFEIKSKISNNYSHVELKKKIKKAYVSLFCSEELKNHKKISIARNTTTGLNLDESLKDNLFGLLDIVENVEGNIIELSKNDNIKLNICIVGNGFEFTENELKNDLIEIINKSIYCKEKCKYNDIQNKKCLIDKLKKSIILNIVNIEFNTELNISELNKEIIEIIDERGLDIRC